MLFFGYIDRRFQDFLNRYDEEVSKISYDHFTIEDFKK
ncbi:putative EsaC-like protein (Listeria type 3) [Streptococcus oralis]|uniref:Putative EsaC-like protein (Listeria type 3) n=1 Tax=Streptococcus oralis TaxID=1303 RepID=A0A139PUL4_STROR|nr:putative EsaC-like protein (Listeria type 3) [Streptococcus oralis]